MKPWSAGAEARGAGSLQKDPSGVTERGRPARADDRSRDCWWRRGPPALLFWLAMLQAGYFRVGRLAAVVLRLHWSLPVGALLFGSLRLEPILWLVYLGVVTLHVLGHALFVKALGFEVVGADLTGFGGQCRFRGSADALEHAIIAWGGILAQSVLLIIALSIVLVFGHATSHAGALVEQGCIQVNLWIIALNALPFAPLDGARAWRLFAELDTRGWTLSRLLMHPLSRWADQRRRRRTGEAGSVGQAGSVEEAGSAGPSPMEAQSNVGHGTPRRRVSPVPAAVNAADAERGAADDDADEKPSAEAQRQLAALLERIGDEAGKAKKRR
jgi:stage IV sporulation protein FB